MCSRCSISTSFVFSTGASSFLSVISCTIFVNMVAFSKKAFYSYRNFLEKVFKGLLPRQFRDERRYVYMAAKSMNTVGRWAFLIGVLLAIILGALGIVNSTWMSALILIGLIVGFLNISERESSPFLLAGVSLIIASALGKDVMSGLPVLYNILQTLLAVFVPSTIVVAIKHVFSLARN